MKKLVLKDKAYTTLKWILATGVAPTITLIEGLGKLYNFDTHYITMTIALFASFFGALIGYSNYNYKKGE